MDFPDPSSDTINGIIGKIKSDSAVGIDTQYTHAVIITYLQEITKRLDDLERKIALKDRNSL